MPGGDLARGERRATSRALVRMGRKARPAVLRFFERGFLVQEQSSRVVGSLVACKGSACREDMGGGAR